VSTAPSAAALPIASAAASGAGSSREPAHSITPPITAINEPTVRTSQKSTLGPVTFSKLERSRSGQTPLAA
jgi:hypothetical protein